MKFLQGVLCVEVVWERFADEPLLRNSKIGMGFVLKARHPFCRKISNFIMMTNVNILTPCYRTMWVCTGCHTNTHKAHRGCWTSSRYWQLSLSEADVYRWLWDHNNPTHKTRGTFKNVESCTGLSYFSHDKTWDCDISLDCVKQNESCSPLQTTSKCWTIAMHLTSIYQLTFPSNIRSPSI